MAHWGGTFVTGRGLLALSGKGQIYQVTLKAEEQYVVHPRCVRWLGICATTDNVEQCPRIFNHKESADTIPIQVNCLAFKSTGTRWTWADAVKYKILPQHARNTALEIGF